MKSNCSSLKLKPYNWTILLLAYLLGGCAAAPIQEMSDARQSIQAARAAAADLYAPMLFSGSEDQLDKAEQSLARHSYGSAKEQAVAAKEQAVSARNVAVAISDAEDIAAKAKKLGLLDKEVSQSLEQAKAAAGSADPGKTIALAEDAELRLKERINQYFLDQSRPLLDEARILQQVMTTQQLAELRAAEDAYNNRQGESAYNRMADLIFSGQELNIQQAPSPKAVAAALAHARDREEWSIGVIEEIDRRYIDQHQANE